MAKLSDCVGLDKVMKVIGLYQPQPRTEPPLNFNSRRDIPGRKAELYLWALPRHHREHVTATQRQGPALKAERSSATSSAAGVQIEPRFTHSRRVEIEWVGAGAKVVIGPSWSKRRAARPGGPTPEPARRPDQASQESACCTSR